MEYDALKCRFDENTESNSQYRHMKVSQGPVGDTRLEVEILVFVIVIFNFIQKGLWLKGLQYTPSNFLVFVF